MAASAPKKHFQKTTLASAIALALTAPLSMQAMADCEPETPSFIVNSNADNEDYCDNLTTLREAVNHANATPGTDTITFDSSVTGTIELNDGTLRVTESVNIVGKENADDLELKANLYLYGYADSNVIDATISGLTLTAEDPKKAIIRMSGYGGSIELDNIKVNADTSHGLILTEAQEYAAGEGQTTRPADLKLTLKNSRITGANFTTAVIRASLRGDAPKGVIKILDTEISGVTSASGLVRLYSGGSSGASDLNIVAERSNISGGSWNDPIFEAEGNWGDDSTNDLMLSDVTVKDNHLNINEDIVNIFGGGTSGVLMQRSVVSGNIAKRIVNVSHSDTTTLTITDTELTGNKVDEVIVSDSYNNTGKTEIVNTTISNNLAYGGIASPAALRITGGSNHRISDTRIHGNEMAGLHIYPRSHETETTTALIENSTISGNSSAKDGAGIRAISRSNMRLNLEVRNTTISGNTSKGSGAGIMAYSEDYGELNLKVSNSTISGNVAEGYYGGGIFLFEGKGSKGTTTATISNTSIVNNSSDGYGGGVGARHSVEASISNSIIAANSGGYDNNNDLFGDFSSVQNTLIQDNAHSYEGAMINGVEISLVGNGEGQTADTGNNLLGVDAKLSELKLIAGSWIHELLADSPAIAAGNAAAADLPATEQRGEGFARVRETAEGNELDLGAVQYFVNPVAVADSTSFSLDVGNATINVLANDAQSSGAMGLDIASVVVMTAPDNGTVEVQEDGSIVYTVTGDYVGDDSFTYVVNDLSGYTSNEATVTVTITEKASEATGHKKDSGSISLFFIGLIGLVGARRLRRKI